MAAIGAGSRSRARFCTARSCCCSTSRPSASTCRRARAIVRHIHELARTDNIGVLWATHLFDEVEPDDDLLVLNKGRIVARGVAKDVVAETGAGDLGGAFRLLIGGDTEEDVAA